jgi:hypothetical protein
LYDEETLQWKGLGARMGEGGIEGAGYKEVGLLKPVFTRD